MKPTTTTNRQEITIKFLDLIINIETMTGRLMAKENGIWSPIDYQNITHGNFQKKYSKNKNIQRPKAKIFTALLGDHIFTIDLAIKDKRLFFLLWTEQQYRKYRGKPKWQASYYHNKQNKTKQWFEEDLSTPLREWPINPPKENPQKMVTQWNQI